LSGIGPLAAAALACCILAAGTLSVGAQTTLPPIGTPLDFALTTADGAAVTAQSYRGKWLLVYFGYTFCPDVCPTTLMEIAGALKALGPRAEAVQPLFVTVDPRRDTPEVLREYVKAFDPRLVGLTGTPAQIALAAKNFHVFYERQDNDDGSYSYDRSAFVYVIGPDGKFVRAIGPGTDGNEIANAIAALMGARP